MLEPIPFAGMVEIDQLVVCCNQNCNQGRDCSLRSKISSNELADWIQCTEFYGSNNPHINDKMDLVEAMLRQQQAEIEALKNELDRAVELYTDKAIENEALKKERAKRKAQEK